MADGGRKRLTPWVKKRLDRGDIHGLRWVNKTEGTFRMSWWHGSKHGWNASQGQLFKEWAAHTGSWHQGQETDYPKWKTRIRVAFNKSKDLEEQTQMSDLTDQSDPYKVYKFVRRVNQDDGEEDDAAAAAIPSNGDNDLLHQAFITGDGNQMLPSTVDDYMISIDHRTHQQPEHDFSQIDSGDLVGAAKRPKLESSLNSCAHAGSSQHTTVSNHLEYRNHCSPSYSEMSQPSPTAGHQQDQGTAHTSSTLTQLQTQAASSTVTQMQTQAASSTLTQLQTMAPPASQPQQNNATFTSTQVSSQNGLPETTTYYIQQGNLATPMDMGLDTAEMDLGGPYMRELTNQLYPVSVAEVPSNATIAPQPGVSQAVTSQPVPVASQPAPLKSEPGNQSSQQSLVQRPKEHEFTVRIQFRTQQVAEHYIWNINGCRLFYSDCSSLQPDPDRVELLGPIGPEQIKFPPISDGVIKNVNQEGHTRKLLDNMDRGILLQSEKGDIYATRLCRCHLFVSSSQKENGDPQKLERNERTKIYSHKDFLDKVGNHLKMEGKAPSPDVLLTFGQRLHYDRSPDQVMISAVITNSQDSNLLSQLPTIEGSSIENFLSAKDEMDKVVEDMKGMSMQ